MTPYLLPLFIAHVYHQDPGRHIHTVPKCVGCGDACDVVLHDSFWVGEFGLEAVKTILSHFLHIVPKVAEKRFGVGQHAGEPEIKSLGYLLEFRPRLSGVRLVEILDTFEAGADCGDSRHYTDIKAYIVIPVTTHNIILLFVTFLKIRNRLFYLKYEQLIQMHNL